jgi:hypothetical protein
MAFPYTVLDQRIELLFSGVWTDITSYVQRRSSLPTIRRGRSDEAGNLERSTDGMSLNNRDGRFSPRNPEGPYYGLLNRNTRLRHSLPNASGSYLSLPGSLTDRATCPDASALGITGDIDVRIDLTPDSWRSLQPLVGKWTITSDERSWVLQLNADGTLTLLWTTAGTLASVLYSASTAPVPVPASGRRAVRVTLDVDNGSAGHTAAFYYADTITGTWLALGDPVVTAGTTSIYDGTGVVEVGSVVDLDAGEPLTGAVNMFELRSGIAGTVVANPNFMIQTAGDNAFADTASSPNTWTMQGDAAIDDRDYRFYGEVPAWPARSDTTGEDVWVPIEAAGILRRLGQGADILDSPMRRVVPMSSTPGPAAYWPCEDGSSATQIASALPGVNAMHVAGEPSFASSSVFVCSDALPTVGDSVWTGGVPPYTPVDDHNDVRWLMHIPSSGVTNGAVVMRIISSEYTAHRWDITYTTASNGTIILTVYDSYSTLLHTSPPITDVDGVIAYWQFAQGQSGADVSYFLTMLDVDGTSGVSTMGAITPAEFGRVNSVIVGPTANVGSATIGHISVHGTSEVEDVLYDSLKAYDGEFAGRRIQRLCSEQDVPFRTYGDLDSTPAMGPQPVDTLLNLITECVDTDGGLLSEPREVFGLGYLPRASLYNQETCLTLDYASGELFDELQPTGDDRYLRNRVTVSRRGGSSATEQLETGPLSVQQAPDGVGLYPESVRLNTQTDGVLRGHAGWRLHLGTVDEERFPSIAVNLANPRIAADTALVAAASAVDIGSVVAITSPPAWLPPGTISQLVQGTAEVLGNFERSLSFNTSPASPYTVGVTDTSARADTGGCTLGSDITSTATSSWSLVSPGSLWVTSTGRLTANPDMEVSVGNWTGVGGTISQVATPAGAPFGGSWSMQLVPNGVSSLAYAESDSVAVSVGTTYRSYAWLRCATSRNVQLRIGWDDAGGSLLSVSTVSLSVNAGQWTEFSTTAVAPASAVTARVFPLMSGTPAASDVLLADVVMLATPTSNAPHFPILLDMAGEHVLLRTCTGSSSPQTGSGRRSQNGVVKAQTAGATIRLAYPTIVAL